MVAEGVTRNQVVGCSSYCKQHLDGRSAEVRRNGQCGDRYWKVQTEKGKLCMGKAKAGSNNMTEGGRGHT